MKALWTIPIATSLVLAGFGPARGPIHASTDDETQPAPRTMKLGLEVLPVIEGELRAASTLFTTRPEAGSDGSTHPETLAEERDLEALDRGIPGGVWADGKFTVLLIDGRVLGKLRAARAGRPNAVRVIGMLHDGGRSMTPFRVEYRNGAAWAAFDLPVSGTSASGVLRGDD